MSRPLSHSDYEQLLGAYALDAVDGTEAAAVELHLADCPRCRAEVAMHIETAALLGHAGAEAPEGLWDRISGELREAPPALTLVRAPAGTPRPVAGLAGSGPAVGLAAAGSAGPGRDLARAGARNAGHATAGHATPGNAGAGAPGRGSRSARRVEARAAAERWRRRVSVRPVAALAVVAALVIGVLGFEISNLQGQVTQVRQSVTSGGLQQLTEVALGTPGHETVMLRSPVNKKKWASAVVVPNGQGYLIDAKLPKLAANKTYQLWGLTDGRAISLALLGDAPNRAAFQLEFAQVSKLMITVEPVGGVQHPDLPAVVSGTTVSA